VEQADCQTLERLLKLGPPINLRDPETFPIPEKEKNNINNNEIHMLWYESDKKEHSAKLKDSLTGGAREVWWEQHKIFVQKEGEDNPSPPRPSQSRSPLRGSVASFNIAQAASQVAKKRGSVIRKTTAVVSNGKNGSHGNGEKINLECLSCFNEINKGNRNYCEYQLKQGGKWYQSNYCTTCTERLLATQYSKFLLEVQNAPTQGLLDKVLQRGPPINLKDNQGYPIPDDENQNLELHLLWFENDNEERSAKLVGSLSGGERQRWWDEHKNLEKNNKKRKSQIEEKTNGHPAPGAPPVRSSVAFDMILQLEGNSNPDKIHRISQIDKPLQQKFLQSIEV